MFLQTWFLPFLLLLTATVIAFPLGRYLAWIMDGKYRPLPVFRWFEKRLDSGPQDWKQYAGALLVFNIVLFVYGYVVLALQKWMPLNPDGKGTLFPSTIFQAVTSFMTNTDLQHWAGDVHLSNFSQIFFCISMLFISAAVGFSALVAIIRALRGDSKVGNYFLDMWRILVYMFVPIAFVIAFIFMVQGSPMTFKSSYQVSTLEPAAMGTTDKGEAKQQTIVVGPGGSLRVHEDARDQRRRILRHELRPSLRESYGTDELLELSVHDDVPLRPCNNVRPHARPSGGTPSSSFPSCCC